MAETALTSTTAPGKWSTTGTAVTMAAVDNSNGNKFTAVNDALVIVQNSSGGSLTFQMTSSAITGSQPGSGRTGNVSQSMAAGEIRVFRVTKNGWQDGNGYVLLPTGLNTSLKVGVVVLAS